MVHYKLIRSQDGKEYKWERLNYNVDDWWDILKQHKTIILDTWKGQYSLENNPPPNIFGEHGKPVPNGDATSFPLWIVSDGWHDCEQCHAKADPLKSDFYIYHPLKKEWVKDPEMNANLRNSIIQDIINWILEQPPQMNQLRAVYEEDRVSVEETFTNILAEKMT